jgi:hypothetical protein
MRTCKRSRWTPRCFGIPLVVAGVLFGAGCGGAQHSAEHEVRATIMGLARAIADGNAKAACALMTPRHVQRMIRDDGSAPGTTCAEWVSFEHLSLFPRERRVVRQVSVGAVEIEGDTAAVLAGQVRLDGHPTGGDAPADATELRRVDGSWLVD